MQIKKGLTILLYLFASIGLFFTLFYISIWIGLTNQASYIDKQSLSFSNRKADSNSTFWLRSKEWEILKKAIVRDAGVIHRSAYDSGVEPRILVALLVPEQLRLFYGERELFKKFFLPLSILGNQVQFSWGIMGIKEDTAKKIELNLKDKDSQFYLGPKFEKSLDYYSDSADRERFLRLTDEKNHYYSYYYAGLYLRQIMNQWKMAGFNIDKEPGILATLFNIGFNHSKPNSKPNLGGADLEIADRTISFGKLAEEFYYSDELIEIFPVNNK